jgi:hypothetical protein
MKTQTLTGILLLLLGLFSCQRGPWMEEARLFPDQNWIRFETQWFDFTPPAQQKSADLRLSLTYNENINLDRLPVMATIHAPSGEMRYRELMFHLRDESGQFQGAEILEESGRQWKLQMMMRQDFEFREEGLYRFEIENLSSKYDNPGLVSLELRVEAP